MMNDLEMDMAKLKELRCTRCGSERLARGIIKRKYNDGIYYFEQILKCKECEQEIVMQVRI